MTFKLFAQTSACRGRRVSFKLSVSAGLKEEVSAFFCLQLLPELIPQECFGIKYPSQISANIISNNGQLGVSGREEERQTDISILALAVQKKINVC